MIKCNYCTSDQKGDLPDEEIYAKSLLSFSSLFGERAIVTIRFDEFDVCYAIWSNGDGDEIAKERLNIKYCPMCGRKLKPAHGRYKLRDESTKKATDFLNDVSEEIFGERLWR